MGKVIDINKNLENKNTLEADPNLLELLVSLIKEGVIIDVVGVAMLSDGKHAIVLDANKDMTYGEFKEMLIHMVDETSKEK